MLVLKINNSIIKNNDSIINHDTNTVNIGGKSYKTTRIGNTIWLAEDLMLTWEGLQLSHFGSWIEASSYTTHNSYPNTYYYNDYAVTELKTTKAALLPTGWRIPTEADYQYFINNFTSNVVIKSTTGWQTGGTNTTGFNLYPVGTYGSGGSWNNSNGTDLIISTLNRYFRVEYNATYCRFINWAHNFKKYNVIRLCKNAE